MSAFQAEALTALLTISFHPVNVLAFTTEGGLSAVLKAMARHPAHAGVQEAGCAVLRNLAVDGDTVRRIVTEGGATAVLAAMRAHVPEVALQVEALGALRNLATEASNRSVLRCSELFWSNFDTCPGMTSCQHKCRQHIVMLYRH